MTREKLIDLIIRKGKSVDSTLELRNACAIEPISTVLGERFSLNPSDTRDIECLFNGIDGPRYQNYAQPLWRQLPIAIDRLNTNEDSRQAVVTIHSAETNTCWISFQVMIRGEELHITGFLRSWDVIEYGDLDMTALKLIATYVHTNLVHQDIRLGNATIIAGSAHIKARPDSYFVANK